MSTKALGHVVLKVKDLKKSVPFYRDILGLKEVAKYGDKMVFFSFGENHHDLALMEIGSSASSPNSWTIGLYHVAFKIGDDVQELKWFKDRLEWNNIRIVGMSDHKVSQSIYFLDPDGIQIEAYVDADPKTWKDNPESVATAKPLSI